MRAIALFLAAACLLAQPAKLMDPSKLAEKAPEQYRAKFTTTKGEFVILVKRVWAPLAADRFYNLVKNGFYDNTAFHRVHPGFVAQWGLHGNPAVQAKWEKAKLKDEPVKAKNTLGMVAFAADGADSRNTQVYVNLKDNPDLNRQGFPVFGDVVQGVGVFARFHVARPEPNQPMIQKQGNAYLKRAYPQMDYVTKAVIE